MKKAIIFSSFSKRESIRKAINYYHKYKCDGSIEEFISKCRLQKDKITIYYYPDMAADVNKYREYIKKIDEKRKYEKKSVIGRGWGFGQFLRWIWRVFK